MQFRNMHCKQCGKRVQNGHNYMNHRGGVLHNDCLEQWKFSMSDRERIRSKTRYRDPEKHKQYCHTWYIKNKERILTKHRAYAKAKRIKKLQGNFGLLIEDD